jgi:tRNA (adenine57-N1/adenine58-N1)-methyltransferase
MISLERTSAPDSIHEGDRVMLYLDSRRMWLVQVPASGTKFHTHAGIVELYDLRSKRYGDQIGTTLGANLAILKPVALDYIMKSERRTQIVYAKDFAYIAARSGIRSGSKVLECGTGSGALSTFFASLVAPTGRVDSFEERDDFLKIAEKNLAKAKLSDCVRLTNANLSDATLEEEQYDLAVLDTGDPWLLVDKVHYSLKGSAFLFAVCPTTNQLENVATAMEGKFVDVESVEIFLRKMEARPGKTRPSMRMIGHTCYLISGRKVNTGQITVR